MEHLAKLLTDKVVANLGCDKQQQQIIGYGMIMLVQMCLFVGTLLVLGLWLNMLVEPLLICVSVAILRKYSGGAHAKSIESCTLIGVTTCLVLAFVSRQLVLQITFIPVIIVACVGSFLLSLALIIYLAPVASKNKPIKTTRKRSRMKRNSLLVWLGCFMISSICFLLKQYSWCFSITLGVLWQSLSLIHIKERNALQGGEPHEKN